jgi:hypothetical protein
MTNTTTNKQTNKQKQTYIDTAATFKPSTLLIAQSIGRSFKCNYAMMRTSCLFVWLFVSLFVSLFLCLFFSLSVGFVFGLLVGCVRLCFDIIVWSVAIVCCLFVWLVCLFVWLFGFVFGSWV